MKHTYPRCRYGPSRNDRRGFCLSELIVAILLTLAALAGVARLLTTAGNQYRVIDEQTVATREVANIMEDMMVRPWAKIGSADSVTVPVSDLARDTLRDVQLQVKISVPDDDPGARRIQVQIHWITASARPAAPVQLTAWRFQDQEDRP